MIVFWAALALAYLAGAVWVLKQMLTDRSQKLYQPRRWWTWFTLPASWLFVLAWLLIGDVFKRRRS